MSAITTVTATATAIVNVLVIGSARMRDMIAIAVRGGIPHETGSGHESVRRRETEEVQEIVTRMEETVTIIEIGKEPDVMPIRQGIPIVMMAEINTIPRSLAREMAK